MEFPLIVQVLRLSVVILLVFRGNEKWGRWLLVEHSMSERVKAELTVPHALHLFHPAYQEAQLKAEEGHTWPSEKRKKKLQNKVQLCS